MDISVFSKSKRFKETKFQSEEEFENLIKNNSKLIFGEKTIYLDIKNKINSPFLGGSIPDGILFDFNDPEEVNFTLIEVELAKHDFYKHIFPQITKFLAFFNHYYGINILAERLFNYINDKENLVNEFKRLSGSNEIYKIIRDSIENNSSILIVIDDEKKEISEVMDVYTDTWDKKVFVGILKRFFSEQDEILIFSEDYFWETLLEEGILEERGLEKQRYSEAYHLEDKSEMVKEIYAELKTNMISLNKNIFFNPQKYYISFKDNRNFAYLRFSKNKIKVSIILPYPIGEKIVKNHKLRKFTEGIERFYGGPSFEVKIENEEDLDEIITLLRLAYESQKD